MSESVAFCPQCGVERWPGAAFCAGCGFDIASWESTRATSPSDGEAAGRAPADASLVLSEEPAPLPDRPSPQAPAGPPASPGWSEPAWQPGHTDELPSWSDHAPQDDAPTTRAISPSEGASPWPEPGEPAAAPLPEPVLPASNSQAVGRGTSLPLVAAAIGGLLIVAVGVIAVFVLAGGTGNATPSSAAVAAPSSGITSQPGAAASPTEGAMTPEASTAPATPVPVTQPPATPRPATSSDLPLGVWTSVGSMPRAAWGAATATLPGGSILIAGGTRGGTRVSKSYGAVARAAVFDATSHTWYTVDSMASRRAYAQAAVIAGGRVLVAGGSRNGVPLATAEIYDPSTRGWSSASSMTMPRTDFALVSLSDGRAMAIGGGHASGKSGASRTVEIYDPATDRWTRTGPLSHPRAYATANLLPDGRVLVAGGSSTYVTRPATQVWSTTEIWDPISGAWSDAGSMSAPRTWQQSVSLADGRVLVTGGWIQPISSSIPPVSSTDLFDPSTDSWTPGPKMVGVRSQHGLVALPNGGAMAIGGTGLGNVPQTSVEVVDTGLTAWREVAQLTVPVWYPAVAVLPGDIVLVAGGAVDSDGINATRATALFPVP